MAGEAEEPENGTPQGGIISPILANIYLHFVLDLWIERKMSKESKGEVIFMRYDIPLPESRNEVNLQMAEPPESAQKLHMETVFQTLERRLADPDAPPCGALGESTKRARRNAPCQRRGDQSINEQDKEYNQANTSSQVTGLRVYLRSLVRENRTQGSARGTLGNWRSYLNR